MSDDMHDDPAERVGGIPFDGPQPKDRWEEEKKSTGLERVALATWRTA